MNAPRSALWRFSTILDLAFPALTVTFGLQLLRVLVPSLVLHRRAASSPVEFAAIAFGTFLLAFLAPLLPRLLGLRRALVVSAMGVASIRVLLQLVRAVDARIVIAAAGVLTFLWFVPIYLGYARGSQRPLNFRLVLLTGILLDTTLHGLFGTADYAWTIAPGTIALAVGLSAAQLVALWRWVRTVEPPAHSDARFVTALPLAGVGLALFFEVILLQNVARLATIHGLPLSVAFLFVVVCGAAGLLIGSLYLSTSAENRTLNLALAAALVFGYVVLPGAITGTSDTRFVLVGNELAALALVMVSHRSGEPGTRAGLWRTSTAWACGMVAFLILTAVYYAGYDTVLPFENDVLFGIAAAVLFVAVLPGLRAAIRNVNPAMDWTPALVGVALIVFPLLVRSTTPRPIPGGDLPLRVMSYNIHMGFDAEGWLDLEAIAQTIESSEADVVALQEVPRGWYINASVDALDWLSRRLDMPYVFAGTADPVWGNAILSRYAIAGSGQSRLPEAGVRPRRGVVWITIDLPGPRDLVVIDTHLHHSSSPPRLEQIPRVIDVYASHADHYRVVLGDMNARPDSAELQLYRDAGLQDAYLLAGGDPASGFTIRSDRPRSRIDYILLSSDLKPGNFQIHASTASDHLGISVTIGK